MRTIDSLHRSGVGIPPNRTIYEAAVLMERSGLGCLAIIDNDQLVGIVTDRDLVRRALAKKLPSDARIDSVMSTPVVTIDADADSNEAFALFGKNGLRRLAVTRAGRFVGVVSVDDLFVQLACQLENLARPVMAEMMFSHHDAHLPVAK